MVNKTVHVSLDIGTSSIKVIVAEYIRNQLNVIGVGVEPSNGLSRGIIVDIDATVEAIKKAVKQAEDRSGIKIKNVIVGVPSNQIAIESCQGMIAVASENKEITDKDVNNVIAAAKVRSVPPEREIISIIPEEFVVDGFNGIRDPRGMIGVRLELYAHLFTGPKTIVHNIRRCVERAGLAISELVIQPLATSHVALTQGERSFGTVLIDMGGGQTSVAAIHDEQVKFVFIDQEGGEYVTKDISAVLNTSMNSAERVKKEFGYAIAADVTKDRFFPIETVGQKDLLKVEESYLAEIIEARVVQTFETVKRALDGVDALSLPGGIVLTGGAAALPGVVELAQDIFDVPVQLYVPEYMGLRHPSYAQALGLLAYATSLDDIHQLAQFEKTTTSNEQRPQVARQAMFEQDDDMDEDVVYTQEKKSGSGIFSKLKKQMNGFLEAFGED